MFSYNITWGATKKEVERSNFFIEVPRILKRFWLAFAISFACFAVIAIFSTDLVTEDWIIPGSDWAVIFPLALVAGCHVLFPVSLHGVWVFEIICFFFYLTDDDDVSSFRQIILNPWLMVFSY